MQLVTDGGAQLLSALGIEIGILLNIFEALFALDLKDLAAGDQLQVGSGAAEV